FFQAEDGIRDPLVTGVQTCALPIFEHHPELVRDAEFLVNEGGTIRLGEDRRVEYYGVGTTEKSPFWLQLVARGTAGHGSRPTPRSEERRVGKARSAEVAPSP